MAVAPTKTPPLVWANGMPLERDKPDLEMLQREISAPGVTGVRSVISGHPAQGLTPQRLTSMLRSAENGNAVAYLELAEEMEEKDLHYLGVLGTRKRQVAQLPMTVIPASDSPDDLADAKLIEDWKERDTLETELVDILDAVGKGYSATEIIWGMTGDLLLPQRLEWRDPRWFEFDITDGRTLRFRGDEGALVDLPAAKFIVHVHPAKSGLAIRGGLARAAAWGWLFKNYAIKDWVGFLEMFGLPMRIGKYPNGTLEPEKRKLMQAVAQLGSDAAAVIPDSMTIDFIDGKQGAAPADLWRAMAEFFDDQVSKAVLGQTSSSDAKAGGLGSGQAELHNDVRGDIERADAKLLAATLNRDLVPAIVMLNRGPRARYPRIRIGRPEAVDVKAMTEAITALVPMGVKVGMEAVRERAGLPPPKDDEDQLGTPAQNGAQNPGQEGQEQPGGPDVPEKAAPNLSERPKTPLRAVSSANANPDPDNADTIDQVADEALGDWEPMIDALLAPIDALMATSSSLIEVRDALAAQLGAMDVATFTQLLERSSFAARLAGDVDTQTQQRS